VLDELGQVPDSDEVPNKVGNLDTQISRHRFDGNALPRSSSNRSPHSGKGR
jgi:hypothetical protein